MCFVHSFDPVSQPTATVLILGSMPGKESLRKAQYYAHPRNLFWPFMQELLSIPVDAAYAQRCAMLKEKKIALWDSLKTCTRSSSLDADIVASSIVTNDFASFFRAHPDIRLIGFNGAKSQDVFTKRVVPQLGCALAGIELVRLPSTSPANAAIPRDVKLRDWQVIVT